MVDRPPSPTPQGRSGKLTFSLVVPVFNEAANLPRFTSELFPVLESLGESFEVVFVDDGSADGTLDWLKTFCARERRAKVISLSRNFGQQVALSAGIEKARGEAVVTIDADNQIPPSVIPQLAAKWREGYDLVYTVRRRRAHDPSWRLAASSLFHRAIRLLSKTDLPANTSDCRLLGPRAVQALRSFSESHRYVRGLVGWIGFRQAALDIDVEPRYAGHSRHSIGKLMRLAFDATAGFSNAPLKLAFVLGVLGGLASLALLFDVIYARLVLDRAISGWASLMTALAFFGSIQLITLGILGEYIGRIYEEVKRRPLYLIKEEIGMDAPPSDDERPIGND